MSDSFNLYDRLAETAGGQRIIDMLEEQSRERDGAARQAQWDCEDGWVVIYTTTRIQGGPHTGNFLAQLFKPNKAKTEWQQVERRVCGTRKEAKARAVKWYREHSPKWTARHPEGSVGDRG